MLSLDAPAASIAIQARRLEGAELLAALYRLQIGETIRDARFTNVATAGDVDWAGFPVVAALEAITREEVRRLYELGRDPPRSSAGC